MNFRGHSKLCPYETIDYSKCLMLEVRPESTGKILWLRAAGRLTDRGYREVFTPSLEAAIREHGKVRAFLQEHLAEAWIWIQGKKGRT